MQFRGQTHLIRVALPNRDVSRATLQALFEAAYFQRFQVELPEIRAVLVNLATSVVGKRRTLPLATLIDASGRKDSAEAAIVSRRPLFADGAWHEAPVYQREMLPLGAVFAGPAVVQQVDATTIIEPGWTARVDEIGNLRISAGVAA